MACGTKRPAAFFVVLVLFILLVATLIATIVLAVQLSKCNRALSSSSSRMSMTGAGSCSSNNGKEVGPLSRLGHRLSGAILVLDSKHIRVKDLNYDGTAPAAFFWIGIKGTSSATPDETGQSIPDEHGNSKNISNAYQNADIVLTLPGNITVQDLLYIGMWCKQFKQNFGHVAFPADFQAPQVHTTGTCSLGPLSNLDHDLSGIVFVLDQRHLQIKDLTYDGLAPAAFFWIGLKGRSSPNPDTTGVAIPDENGRTDRILNSYNNVDIILALPDNITVDNLLWFGMWCKQVKVSFGHVYFPESFDVPKSRVIGRFPDIISGTVRVLTDKTIIIDKASFVPSGFNADNTYFSVGKNETGMSSVNEVPKENVKFDPLKMTATIILPNTLRISDINFLGVYETIDKTLLTSIFIPPLLNVPAYRKP